VLQKLCLRQWWSQHDPRLAPVVLVLMVGGHPELQQSVGGMPLEVLSRPAVPLAVEVQGYRCWIHWVT